MPDLLLELFSEEIPARMQVRAAADLRQRITDGLVAAGLTYEGAVAHVTPRRLVLAIAGLEARAADTVEERKGPRVDAPAAALEGFLKSTGLSLSELTIQDDKKGQFYVARIRKPGREAPHVIADLVPEVIATFPWPRSMRWGSGALRWVRPLRSILCAFDGLVVPFTVEGIASGDQTFGHRFLKPGPIQAMHFDDYEQKLRAAFVMVDHAMRADIIRADARTVSFARGLSPVEDEALVAETAGLVEWPVVLMGQFDQAFLDVPPEVIITTIKAHQKCFSLVNAATGALVNQYLLVSNMVASDGGTAIVAGNDRVIAARLSDARFFWAQDRTLSLESQREKLDAITFHAKLGSQGARVIRLEALSGLIAGDIGADIPAAQRAARLAKADLVSGMVGEFPELQGVMGRYYALAQGEDALVADAIRDHYRPQGPSDSIAATGVGQAVALADKIDTLMGFWLIGEPPTGSRDPYALRRAALGLIRSLLEPGHKLALMKIFAASARLHEAGLHKPDDVVLWEGQPVPRAAFDLLAFVAERLKVYLKDKGARHELIDAVFAQGGLDDVLLIVRRLEALSAFLDTDDGATLLAGVKRASNIVRIEEKKENRSFNGDVDSRILIQGEEKALNTAVNQASAQIRRAVAEEDFAAAMRALAKLRPVVDAFFDKVTVNADDPNFRENRLNLLNRVRAATREVADFSRIE